MKNNIVKKRRRRNKSYLRLSAPIVSDISTYILISALVVPEMVVVYKMRALREGDGRLVLTPVSYTHLDVYKRQIYSLSYFPIYIDRQYAREIVAKRETVEGFEVSLF